jgi:hypothetical protein
MRLLGRDAQVARDPCGAPCIIRQACSSAFAGIAPRVGARSPMHLEFLRTDPTLLRAAHGVDVGDRSSRADRHPSRSKLGTGADQRGLRRRRSVNSPAPASGTARCCPCGPRALPLVESLCRLGQASRGRSRPSANSGARQSLNRDPARLAADPGPKSPSTPTDLDLLAGLGRASRTVSDRDTRRIRTP